MGAFMATSPAIWAYCPSLHSLRLLCERGYLILNTAPSSVLKGISRKGYRRQTGTDGDRSIVGRAAHVAGVESEGPDCSASLGTCRRVLPDECPSRKVAGDI